MMLTCFPKKILFFRLKYSFHQKPFRIPAYEPKTEKIHGDRAHIEVSFEWNSVSRWFDLLTIKQIESTNQAINSYKQHNKLKHWHNVSDGLVKLLCSGCGTNRRKIFWYDLVSLLILFVVFSIHWMIFPPRNTHSLCVSSECIKNVFCLSMLVKEIKW